MLFIPRFRKGFLISPSFLRARPPAFLESFAREKGLVLIVKLANTRVPLASFTPIPRERVLPLARGKSAKRREEGTRRVFAVIYCSYIVLFILFPLAQLPSNNPTCAQPSAAFPRRRLSRRMPSLCVFFFFLP